MAHFNELDESGVSLVPIVSFYSGVREGRNWMISDRLLNKFCNVIQTTFLIKVIPVPAFIPQPHFKSIIQSTHINYLC